MQNDWDIKSRAHTCSATGRPFEPGEIFYTLLFREAEGFRREDLSETAWAGRMGGAQPFSFWRSRYEPPPPPPPEPLRKDDAEGMLRHFLDHASPATANVAYILALMLERKKVFIPEESTDHGVLVYSHARTGESFIIPNPGLSLEEIPAVQQEVSQLLADGLPSQ